MIGRNWDSLDEAVSRDLVVTGTIQDCLKVGQVLVTDLKATVVQNPILERTDADRTPTMLIHLIEYPLAVQLQLIALGLQVRVCLQQDREKLCKLVQPRLLKEGLLLKGELLLVLRLFLQTFAIESPSRFQSGKPFIKSDRAIAIRIHDFHQTVSIHLATDTMLLKHLGDFLWRNPAILVVIEQTERFLQAEGLMSQKRHSGIFNLPILLNHQLDDPQ